MKTIDLCTANDRSTADSLQSRTSPSFIGNASLNKMGMRDHACWWALVLGTTLIIAGCTRDATDRCALSGQITLDGRPVDGGNIQIDPLDSKPTSASGAMILAGHYSIPRQTGLAPGKYRVHIYCAEKSNAGIVTTAPGVAGQGAIAAPPRELIPARYNMDSELIIEVSEKGANRFDFDLTTK